LPGTAPLKKSACRSPQREHNAGKRRVDAAEKTGAGPAYYKISLLGIGALDLFAEVLADIAPSCIEGPSRPRERPAKGLSPADEFFYEYRQRAR
jgi:hypothetical protein